MRRKTARQRMMEELDGYIRDLVFARDGHCCVKCGSKKSLTPSHILPKGLHPHLRFEEYNILTMDSACHLFWWHKSPLEAAEWLEKTYPGRMEKLREMAACATRPDLKLLLTVYRREAVNR